MENLQIGDGAFFTSGSDRYPATVVGWNEFKTGKNAGDIREIIVQRDLYSVKSGVYPNCEYEYTPDPTGTRLTFRKNAKGHFVLINGGSYLHVGERRFYYDPHF